MTIKGHWMKSTISYPASIWQSKWIVLVLRGVGLNSQLWSCNLAHKNTDVSTVLKMILLPSCTLLLKGSGIYECLNYIIRTVKPVSYTHLCLVVLREALTASWIVNFSSGVSCSSFHSHNNDRRWVELAAGCLRTEWAPQQEQQGLMGPDQKLRSLPSQIQPWHSRHQR